MVFYVRKSGFFGYAFQVQLMRSVVLSPEAVDRIGAGVLGVVGPCVTSRIWFDGTETEHVDPAIEARQNRYDVDGVHVVAHE